MAIQLYSLSSYSFSPYLNIYCWSIDTHTHTHGRTTDIHVPHWHGQRGILWGSPVQSTVDTLGVLPGTVRVIDMVPKNAGTWPLHCTITDHINAGMVAFFTVEASGATSAASALLSFMLPQYLWSMLTAITALQLLLLLRWQKLETRG